MTCNDEIEIMQCATLESWLRSLPPETEVGTALCKDNCPFVRFLRAHGFCTAEVQASAWNEAHGSEVVWHEMPAWATAFVQAVDQAYGGGDPDGTFHRVTAAEALAILVAR